MNTEQTLTLVLISSILLIGLILILLERDWDHPNKGALGIFISIIILFFGFGAYGNTADLKQVKEEITVELSHSSTIVFGVYEGDVVWKSNDYKTVTETKTLTHVKLNKTSSYNLYNSRNMNPPKYELAR